MSDATTTTDTTRSHRRIVIALGAAMGIVLAVLMISAIGFIIDTFGMGQRASFLPLAIVCAGYGIVGGFIAHVVMAPAEPTAP